MTASPAMSKSRRLRELLRAPGVVQAAGVGDAGQARLLESIGYSAVYMSGSYVNHTRGFPDGMLTLTEIASRVAEIADCISIPLIADADEGFGDVLKIIRTVHEFERCGASALHLEDMPVKKHGNPMPIPHMVKNIQAALDARNDPDLFIIARTDAMTPWRQKVLNDFEACETDAFERCLAYAQAGADMVMPIYPSVDWLKRYGSKIPKPLLILTHELSARELEQYNVKVVIYPVDMLTRSFHFMKNEYAKWLADGRVIMTEQDRIDRIDANELVGFPEKDRIMEKYRP